PSCCTWPSRTWACTASSPTPSPTTPPPGGCWRRSGCDARSMRIAACGTVSSGGSTTTSTRSCARSGSPCAGAEPTGWRQPETPLSCTADDPGAVCAQDVLAAALILFLGMCTAPGSVGPAVGDLSLEGRPTGPTTQNTP